MAAKTQGEKPTQAEFAYALRGIPVPQGRQLDFLREHAQAYQRRLSARQLAESAGYKGYRGINLQYGLLARRIAEALDRSDAHLRLLVEFIPPENPGVEWRLVMRAEFANALKQAGWI
jgi:hypothetical protein